MATRLTLVSHAPTVATRAARFPDDEPPDEHGTAQAGAASAALRRVDETRCGPELRCRRTAAALGLTPVIDPALADLNAGVWRGRGLAELVDADAAGLQAWLSDPAAAPHGGETLHDLLSRVAGWLDGVGGTTGRIVAITHPSVIRAALIHVLRARPESFWRVDVTPLSRTELAGSGGRWTLRETGHPLAGAPDRR